MPGRPVATNYFPEQFAGSITRGAKDLVVVLALDLAKLITSLFRQALSRPTQVLYDSNNELLLMPKFWVRPIYAERTLPHAIVLVGGG